MEVKTNNVIRKSCRYWLFGVAVLSSLVLGKQVFADTESDITSANATQVSSYDGQANLSEETNSTIKSADNSNLSNTVSSQQLQEDGTLSSRQNETDSNTSNKSSSTIGDSDFSDTSSNPQRQNEGNFEQTQSEITAYNNAENESNKLLVSYRSQVQNIGWQDEVTATDASNTTGTAGTTGKSLRLEAVQIHINNETGLDGSIEYSAHVEGIGWQSAVSDNEISGTVGEAKRLEAIRINFIGDIANQYDIYYRTYLQNVGWLGWAKNGEVSGTTGFSARVEALQIIVRAKDEVFSPLDESYHNFASTDYQIQGTAHVENIGWENTETANATNILSLGTTGEGLRLEAYKLQLNSFDSSSIEYSSHVENIGWQYTVPEGEVSGTVGKSLRVEAVKLQLTGPLSNYFDIDYRVHIQNQGWLKWVKNGTEAGTTGQSLRVEDLEVKLSFKGLGETTSLNQSEVVASYEGSGNYRVTTHNVTNPGQVVYAVWSASNGQDDLKWYTTARTGQTASSTFNVSDHIGTGLYYIHSYLKGNDGSMTFLDETTITVEKNFFIDVSSHNGNISVSEYKTMKEKYNISGVVVKLTEGTYYQNPYAASQIRNAQAAGLKVSVYAFARYTSQASAKAEADYFVNFAKQLGLSSSTLMVNDIEATETLTNINENMSAWTTEMARLGYKNVMHYTSASWVDVNNLGYKGPIKTSEHGGISNFWIAQYMNDSQASAEKRNLNASAGAWQFSSSQKLGTSTNFDESIDYTNRFV